MTAKTVSALLVCAALAFAGCAPAGERDTTAAATIAPATPPLATDTDPVPTQTVEIGEDRSPNEGGVLTDPETGGAYPTETTATTTAPAAKQPQ